MSNVFLTLRLGQGLGGATGLLPCSSHHTGTCSHITSGTFISNILNSTVLGPPSYRPRQGRPCPSIPTTPEPDPRLLEMGSGQGTMVSGSLVGQRLCKQRTSCRHAEPRSLRADLWPWICALEATRGPNLSKNDGQRAPRLLAQCFLDTMTRCGPQGDGLRQHRCFWISGTGSRSQLSHAAGTHCSTGTACGCCHQALPEQWGLRAWPKAGRRGRRVRTHPGGPERSPSTGVTPACPWAPAGLQRSMWGREGPGVIVAELSA